MSSEFEATGLGLGFGLGAMVIFGSSTTARAGLATGEDALAAPPISAAAFLARVVFFLALLLDFAFGLAEDGALARLAALLTPLEAFAFFLGEAGFLLAFTLGWAFLAGLAFGASTPSCFASSTTSPIATGQGPGGFLPMQVT